MSFTNLAASWGYSAPYYKQYLRAIYERGFFSNKLL